jgi:hypothetical protein
LYGTTIAGGSTIQLSSNGNVQFDTTGTDDYSNSPLPISTSAAPGVNGVFPASKPTIFAYWDDLDLRAAGNGIFTDISGTAPNRVLKVEWRGTSIDVGNAAVNVALLIREGSNNYEVIYANAATTNGTSATVGVQAASSGTVFTQFGFNSAGSITNGLKLTSVSQPAVCTPGPTPSCALINDPLFSNGFE